jgi:hypothetical protein
MQGIKGMVFGRVAVRDVLGLVGIVSVIKKAGAGFHVGDILVYRVANGDMMQVHDPRDITRVMEKGVCCVADKHEAKTYRNWFPGGDVCGLRNRKIGTSIWSPVDSNGWLCSDLHKSRGSPREIASKAIWSCS